jgi:hypothetical protein
MSNTINPDPVSSEIQVAVEGLNGPKVSVYMPFNLEMDDMTADLFGEKMDISGTIIKVNREIPVDVLYSGEDGWLKYLQQGDEDSFEGYVNSDMAPDVITEINTSLYLDEGTNYDPNNKGVENIDASGAFPNVGSETWQNYANIQDFVLAYFANKILGHPGALAIISNDSALRRGIGMRFNSALHTMNGAQDRAITSNMTTLDDLQNINGHGTSGGIGKTDIELIIQQFMNQAPDRFTTGDRGTLQPLEWKVGDKMYIQLYLRDNKYQLNGNAPVGADHPVLLNPETYNVAAPFGSPGIAIQNDYYVLEFTVGEGAGGGGSSGGGSSGGGSSGGGSSGGGSGGGPSYPSSPVLLTGVVTTPSGINPAVTYTFTNNSASSLNVTLYIGGTANQVLGPIAPGASALASGSNFTGYTAAISANVSGFKNFGEYGSIAGGETGVYSNYNDATGREINISFSKTINGGSTATYLGLTSGGSGTSSGTLTIGTTPIVTGFTWDDSGAEFGITVYVSSANPGNYYVVENARAAFNSLSGGTVYSASIA